MPDAMIIGAGPAGCVAAICLARAGWAVTLVEQHRFPRDKVCGECLSAVGIDVLARLALGAEIAALRPARLRRCIVAPLSGPPVCLDLPRALWGISRRALDQRLLELALKAGARLEQPVRCEQIDSVPRLSIRLRNLQSNAVRVAMPAHLLVADGKGAMPTAPRATADLGVKAHFKGVCAPGDAILLFGLRGHYVGVAPIEGGRWNLAMSVPAERVRRLERNFQALLAEMLDQNTLLRDCLGAAVQDADWMASPLPRFSPARHWPPGVIPIGNAAAAIEPIGGEGIGLAMRSAELAAEALVKSSRTGSEIDQAALRTAYRRLWRHRGLACRAGALVLGSATLSELAAPVLSSSQQFQQIALGLSGKSAAASAWSLP